ncbi:MAG: hypothetical protein AB7I38_17240 [Dehalococcoidia bacterium]
MTGDQLDEYLFRHFTPDFFARVVRAVFAAHEESSREVRQMFEDTEAVNVIPFHRRGKVEAHLRAVAAMYPQIEATVVRGGGGWNHTELRSGRVVLTANAVQAPCGMVEPSLFRATLARDNQMTLFGDPAPANDAPLFVMLLHSRSVWLTVEDRKRFGHLPGSCYLAFPVAGLDYYVHVINLFDMFPRVVAEQLPQDWNQEAQLRYLAQARAAAGG